MSAFPRYEWRITSLLVSGMVITKTLAVRKLFDSKKEKPKKQCYQQALLKFEHDWL